MNFLVQKDGVRDFTLETVGNTVTYTPYLRVTHLPTPGPGIMVPPAHGTVVLCIESTDPAPFAHGHRGAKCPTGPFCILH